MQAQSLFLSPSISLVLKSSRNVWKNLRLRTDDERFLEGNLVRRNRHVDDLEREKKGGGNLSSHTQSTNQRARLSDAAAHL